MSRDIASRTAHVAAAIFAMTMAFFLTKTGRDALFFQGQGLFDLPLAYMGMAVLSVPMAFLMLAAMRRLGPRPTRLLAPLAFAALLLLFRRVARPGGGILMTGFFILVPLAFGVLFSLFWLLAAELLDGATRQGLARAYAWVGAASIAGGMAGGALGRALSVRIEPAQFLGLGAVALVLAVVAVAVTQARFPMRPLAAIAAETGPPDHGVRAVLNQPYGVLLLGTGMTASLVGMLVDFQFYLAAATSGADARSNARFFAGVYMILNAIALAAQVFLMPRLQRAIGIHGSLLVLPVALVGGATGLLASASLLLPSLVRIAEGGLRSSIHRANWEQAFLPLGRAQRASAKLLVDGSGARIAEGVAALLMFLWLHLAVRGGSLVGRDVSFFAYLLLASTLAWVLLTRRLGRSSAASGAAAFLLEEARPQIPLPDS